MFPNFPSTADSYFYEDSFWEIKTPKINSHMSRKQIWESPKISLKQVILPTSRFPFQSPGVRWPMGERTIAGELKRVRESNAQKIVSWDLLNIKLTNLILRLGKLSQGEAHQLRI